MLFFTLIVASYGISDTLQKQMPVVVSIGWLKTHLNDKNIVVIDVRKNKAYRKGHIKGAVNMPVMKDFFTKKTLKMPKLTYLKELFSNAGIDTNTKVIVYDKGQFRWAARACWVLKVLGHKDESLLRYGYGNYIKKHLPISVKSQKQEEKSLC